MNLLQTFIITLILTLPPCLSALPPPMSVKASFSVEVEFPSPEQNQQYYIISLADRTPDTSLLISLTSPNDRAPKIYIDNSQDPTNNHKYSETSSSGYVVLWKAQELENTPFIYILLVCSLSSCEATLDVSFTKEVMLEANGEPYVYDKNIEGLTSAIARLHLPESADADRIVIHVDTTSRDPLQASELDLKVSKGDSIPSFNHAENIARDAWYVGRTTVIYKDDNLFCTGCQYTLSLKFSSSTQLRIEAHVLATEMKLNHISYLDAVRKGSKNTYYYQVSDTAQDRDVVLSLKASKGSLAVKIDCAPLAEDPAKAFQLSYEAGKASEQIVLTEKDHQKCLDKKYRITIEGKDDVTYSIKATARDAANLMVKRDSPVVGTIFAEEKIDYEFVIPYYLTEKVHLKLETKGDVNMEVINCKYYSQCPNQLFGKITHTGPESNQPDSIYPVTIIEGGKEAVIDVKTDGCYGIEFEKEGMLTDEEKEGPVCAFKITLRSREAGAVEYALSASMENHQLLYAGVTEKGVVDAGEKLYYMLHVTQESLMSIQFQLTVQSGDARIYVSKNNEFPEATEGASVDHEGAVVYKHLEHFNGNYYVTVKGIKTSSFRLSAVVISPNSQPIDYATTLEEGDQHKGVMTKRLDEKPEQFYKISLNLQEDWKGKLKISVSTLRGELIIAVNTDASSIPTKGHADWVSKNHILEISSEDPLFKKQNIYHIGLYLNEESLDATQLRELKELTYTISYVLLSAETQVGGVDSYKNQEHMLLTTAFPHHGSITAGHVLYFKIELHPNDAPVSLFKRASTGDIDIYLSTDPKNQYPGPDNFKLTTTTTHKSELTFQKNDLSAECLNSDDICSVYFSVSTSSLEQVPFTLSLFFHSQGYAMESTPIALEDGKERDVPLPIGPTPMRFYFYPTPRENIFIDVFCPYKDISIYARTEDLKHGVNIKTEPEYPTSSDAPYSSVTNEDNLNTGAAHLAIPIPSDSPAKVVTIIVEFADSVRRGAQSTSKTFSIVASSQTRHLFAGKPNRGEVQEGAYIYYLLEVPKSECTLFITLTNIDDGDPDLYVDFGEYKRPTKESHKYASISRQRTELLEISYLDIYPQHDMKGKWVIGVYGKTNSTFILTASYEDNKMFHLSQSIPVELYLKKDAKMYFKYFHDKGNAFDVRVDKQSGDANVYVTAIGPRSATAADMPNKDNALWRFTEEKQSFLTIDPSDPNFCSECLYIIGIEITKSSKFTLLITEQGGFTLIQSSLRYSDKLKGGEKKYYMLVLKNAEELSLSASISSGELMIYGHNNILVSQAINLWTLKLDPESTYEVITMKKQEFRDAQHVKSINSGTQNVISQENIFYFEFENPGSVLTEYSFSMQPPDATIVLKTNAFQDVMFKEEEDKSLLLYSPHITGSITISLGYCLQRTLNETDENPDDQLSEFTEGFKAEINYWTEKATAGYGTEIALLENNVLIETIGKAEEKNVVCIKQVLEIEDQEQEGRYEIILTNPFDQELTVSIRVDASELGFKSLDRNYYGVEHFDNDEKRSYHITYSGDGYSYMDFFACSGTIAVQYADTLEALKAGQIKEIVLSQFGNQREIFYKDTIKGSGSIYFIVKTHEVSKEFGESNAELLISTSFFTEDTGDYKSTNNLDHIGPLHDPEMTHKYDFAYEDSTLEVNFKSLAISDPRPEYSMVYYIRLCPKGVIRNQQNHCVPFTNPDECYMGHEPAGVKESQTIQHTFGSVPPGEYDLHISARLSYGDEAVRPFAYKAMTLSVGEPFLNKAWDVILFLITVGAILFCVYIGFQRLKTSQRAQGYDVKVFKKTRDYGFVGDDDDDEDLRGEDDNLRKRESN